jgi:hypothetical protein
MRGPERGYGRAVTMSLGEHRVSRRPGRHGRRTKVAGTLALYYWSVAPDDPPYRHDSLYCSIGSEIRIDHRRDGDFPPASFEHCPICAQFA